MPSLEAASAEAPTLRAMEQRTFLESASPSATAESPSLDAGAVAPPAGETELNAGTARHGESQGAGRDAHEVRGTRPPRLKRIARQGSSGAEPTQEKLEVPGARYLKAQTRREVWKRDGGCCAFVSPSGRRCCSTHQLEFHHLVPYARGGGDTPSNITLRCKAHNLQQARKDFGQQHMALFIRSL
jgi:hypothetical protein